jgi:hypothetical protein
MYSLYKNEYRKKKNRGDEPIQVIINTHTHTHTHTHTWKCHKETPCVAILNK